MPQDQRKRPKFDFRNVRAEAGHLVREHRKTLAVGLALMVVNRLARFVLPALPTAFDDRARFLPPLRSPPPTPPTIPTPPRLPLGHPQPPMLSSPHRAVERPIRFGSQYGYSWWVGRGQGRDFYFANGYAGQFILVSPALDLVVVATSAWRGHTWTSAGTQWSGVIDVLVNGVLPAVQP